MFARLLRQLLRPAGKAEAGPVPASQTAAQLIAQGQQAEGEGRLQDALAGFEAALATGPDSAELNAKVGNLLHALGRNSPAIAAYHRAIQLKPDFAAAHHNLGVAQCARDDIAGAIASFRRALEIDANNAGTWSNLLFCLSHSETIDPAALFAEHCRFGERFEAPLRAGWPRHTSTREPERRLRIGLVSADFNDHAVALFIEPLLERMAASSALSLHAYYNSNVDDAVTQRLRRNLNNWQPVAGLDDAAVAEKIRQDEIDILIDLSGHTGGNRLPVFARKPAPVQASWIGYPGTTGLTAMDYYLAGRDFLPPGAFDGQFTEKLVYLPSVVGFVPDVHLPPVNELPALVNGYLTFGSFNRPAKLNRSVITLWSRLLRALPDARMLLGGMPQEGETTQFIAWFEEQGVAAARLRFHRRCSQYEYFALHREVDLCLDSFPYSGGTTTNCALWMGVPTLTLAGGSPASRQGAAYLQQAGLPDFIAATAGEFEQTGLRLARNRGELARLRAGLRDSSDKLSRQMAEVTADAAEQALRAMWRRWCAGLPPESFEIG